jgi:HlyD family secretion protein
MTRRRIIILVNVVAVAIVAALVFLIWPRSQENEESQAAAPTAPAVVPSSRDFARGELVPAQFANLSFPEGGIVEEILVDVGDSVEVAEPLLKLESANQESALAQAQARLATAETDLLAAEAGLEAVLADVTTAEFDVAAAEANLALVEAGASAQEIAAAEQNVEAARAAVTKASAGRDASLEIPASQVRAAEARVSAARAEVEALQQSYDQIINTCFEGPDGTVCPLYGTVEENTRAQLEAAQLNLNSAQAALDALNAGATAGQRQAAAGAVAIALANQEMAEAQLDLLLAGASDEEVRRAEVQVAQAEARVEQAKATIKQAEAGISQAQVGVEIAQAAVDVAQTALERTVLRAVIPGTVSRIDVKVGQLVAPGAPLLALADLEDWLVETTDLSELKIAGVKIGAPVEVTLDAIGGEVLDGTIIDIGRVAQREGGEVIYTVTIDLAERRDLPLRWGMSAEVDFG